MITKVTLSELYDDVFRRSTLICIPHLDEMMVVDEARYTKYQIFWSIVRDALKNFEYYYPLSLIQKVYLDIDPVTRMCSINGNFKAYLDGKVDEDSIVITPASIVGLCQSYYTASVWPLRNFRYIAPKVFDCWYTAGIYYMNTICKRPFIEEYDPVTKRPTDRCAVYYMNKDVDSQYSIFRDEVYLSLCRYLMNLKKNMQLQNMPIELFQGIEEDYNKIDQNQQNIYQNALTQSAWLI